MNLALILCHFSKIHSCRACIRAGISYPKYILVCIHSIWYQSRSSTLFILPYFKIIKQPNYNFFFFVDSQSDSPFSLTSLPHVASLNPIPYQRTPSTITTQIGMAPPSSLRILQLYKKSPSQTLILRRISNSTTATVYYCWNQNSNSFCSSTINSSIGCIVRLLSKLVIDLTRNIVLNPFYIT